MMTLVGFISAQNLLGQFYAKKNFSEQILLLFQCYMQVMRVNILVAELDKVRDILFVLLVCLLNWNYMERKVDGMDANDVR